MYFQKDYVLRMIEMMGELVRKIGAMMREADAREELSEIAQKACGLPMEMLRSGDTETLAGLLEEPQRFLAAELVLISLEVDRRTVPEETLLPLYQQALALYSTLADPDYVLPAGERVATILSDHLDQLPVASLLRAARLLERAGKYASAEDALYAATEIDPENAISLRAFYDRLSALSDAALLAGGLSRAEIDEGRASLN